MFMYTSQSHSKEQAIYSQRFGAWIIFDQNKLQNFTHLNSKISIITYV